MFVKLQQPKERRDYSDNNAQRADRDLDPQRVAREAGEKWNYGSGHNFRKTQSLEPTLIRAALPIVPADLIVQTLLDIFLGRNHFSWNQQIPPTCRQIRASVTDSIK
jgi:hypothetical protein